MIVQIEIPDDISRALSERWGDIPQRLMETLAVEGYRSGALTQYQVGRVLALEGRETVAAFLARQGVFPEFSEEEFERELQDARDVQART